MPWEEPLMTGGKAGHGYGTAIALSLEKALEALETVKVITLRSKNCADPRLGTPSGDAKDDVEPSDKESIGWVWS